MYKYVHVYVHVYMYMYMLEVTKQCVCMSVSCVLRTLYIPKVQRSTATTIFMYMHVHVYTHALHIFRDVQQLHTQVQSIESTDEQFSRQIEEIRTSVRCLHS